jgi:hypothetical protein
LVDPFKKLRDDLRKRGATLTMEVVTPMAPKRAAKGAKPTPKKVVTAVRDCLVVHRGLSAATIAWALIPELRDFCDGLTGGCASYPSDPDDFSRCRRVLALIPNGVERLDEVAGALLQQRQWAGLAKVWPELDRLWVEEESNPGGRMAKLYARMQEACRG